MELIKELREKTQVGMMDCKKALILAEGDLEKAIEILRKKGASVAAKRAEHATDNGTVSSFISPDGKVGALLEIGCETDFSANTDDMKNFAKNVCEHIINVAQCCPKECEPECLLEQKFFNDDQKTIKMLLDELIAKISENIKISRCVRFDAENGIVCSYIHSGSTLGTMIELEVEGLNDSNKSGIEKLGKDICMQIAVTNPLAIDSSTVDPEILEKEKAILVEQLKASGKPEEMIDKIMVGKINKFYQEVCLIKQKYIKDDKTSVEQQIKNVAKELGCTVVVKQFKRFSIGK